ncbi:MAG: dTDP-4-dehydrorhamnose 3,5-epimerase [Proteobacteria bacterium]|nr:dTDP-4-dehydrorhamnose 3,5-epimerase [Pseudomonadota bacterium]
MSLDVTPTRLPGLLLVETPVFPDSRGLFSEIFRADAYEAAGIPGPFVQDNQSLSVRGVVRGLHFQRSRPQGKLVTCVQGEIFDVAVDLRRSSPFFGQWEGFTLSGDAGTQVYIPEGFAHGFCALSQTALVVYKCTDFYCPGDDRGIRWDDPDLAIPWPVDHPVLSEKDRNLPRLAGLAPELLFD